MLFTRISNAQLATMYFQLAGLDETGIPITQAFKILQNQSAIKQSLQKLQKQLEQGRSLAEAGFAVGILSKFDKAMIVAAESSGQLQAVYRRLALFYEQKAKRSRKLKSKLYLPVFSLVLAQFILPLPAFIIGDLTALSYISNVIRQILLFAIVSYSVIAMPYWLINGGLRFLGMGGLLYRLQLTIPGVANWQKNRQLNLFFYHLVLLHEAGVSIAMAVPVAINSISNPLLKREFSAVAVSLAAGQSLYESLSDIAGISKQSMHLIQVGEQSGKLSESLLHLTKLQAEQYTLEEDALLEWIPRLVYFMVVVWFATSIVT